MEQEGSREKNCRGHQHFGMEESEKSSLLFFRERESMHAGGRGKG